VQSRLERNLAANVPVADLAVLTWAEVEPQMGYMQATSSYFSMIFLIIILLALVFGITNTMLMAVMERVREIGVMNALGMSHGRVFAMIMLETIVLSLLGSLGGIILGIGTTMIFGRVGIDLSAVAAGLESAGMSAMIYPEFAPELYPLTILLVLITAVISAVYPGLKATRLNPVEAMRTYG
jgi:ABC-type antimicrobial peptide transport system permease subunit